MQGIVALLLKCLPEYCLDEFLCPKLLVHFSGFPCPKCSVLFAHLNSDFVEITFSFGFCLSKEIFSARSCSPELFCSFCSPKKNPKGLRCRSTPFCASCTASTFENPFSARGLFCFHTFMPPGMCGILPTSPRFLRPSWPQSLLVETNFFHLSMDVVFLLLNVTSGPVFVAVL